jgi:hypothetical protein
VRLTSAASRARAASICARSASPAVITPTPSKHLPVKRRFQQTPKSERPRE